MDDNILKRDQNHVTVQGAVTDDVARQVRMWLSDPATGRLLVSAVIAGTMNGKLRVSGSDMLYDYLSAKVVSSDGSIVFAIVDPGGNEQLNFTVDQSILDFANISGQVDLETQVIGVLPTENGGTGASHAHPAGDRIWGFDIATDQTQYFVIGPGLVYDPGSQTLSAPGASGYSIVQDNGSPVTQRSILNFVNYFTITDDAGNSRTNIAINVTELAGDSTFVTALVANTAFITALANSTDFIDLLIGNAYFTTTLANDSNFISELTSNTSFLTAISVAISGSVAVVTDATLTGDGTAGSPLSVVGGGGGSGEVVQKTFTQTSHGFTASQVLKSSGTDGEFDLAEADTAANADVVGIITSVPTANTFVLTTQGFAIIPTLPGGAVAGDNLFLSPSTPGALTLIDPAIANVAGTVSQPLARVINAATGLCFINNWRGQEQQSSVLNSGESNNGTTTYSLATASGTQTIPHGLSGIPSSLELIVLYQNGYAEFTRSEGFSNGNGSDSCEYEYTQTSAAQFSVFSQNTASVVAHVQVNNGTDYQEAIATFDATNIILNWTKTGSPTGTAKIVWKAVL